MATMTTNMNGLPAIEAVNDSYSFPTTHTANLILSVLDNDSLGFSVCRIISFIDVDTEANVGTLSITDDDASIGVELLAPGAINVGTYTFTYTIEDSYARTDTATVTITITA